MAGEAETCLRAEPAAPECDGRWLLIAAELIATHTPSRSLITSYYGMRLVSQAAQGAFFAGLFMLATGTTAALGVSGLFAGMMAAAVLFGLAGGATGDRLGAGRAVIAGSAGRGLAIGLGLTIAAIPSLQSHFEFAAAVAFLYSAASQIYCPAELALAGHVAPGRPGKAHATLIVLQYAGQVAGIGVIAPLAFMLAGATGVLAAAAGLSVIVTGLAALTALHVRDRETVASRRHTFRFRPALRYYADQPGAVYAGALLTFGELAMKVMIVALPVYLSRDLKLHSLETGVLVVPGAIAAAAGLYWAGRSLHLHIAPQVMRLTLLGTVAGILALAGLGDMLAGMAGLGGQPLNAFDNGTHMQLAVAIPVSVLLGICFSVAPVGGRALLSATAPRDQQSRVFAMQSTVTDVLALAPMLLAGVGVEVAGARSTFAVVGVAGLAVFLLLEGSRVHLTSTWRPAAEQAS